MISTDTIEMAKELRNILGQIKGVTKVQEGVTLSYCVVVGDEADKPAAEQVAEKLSTQAAHYNIMLDIAVATEADIKEAAEKLKEYQSETQGSFTF